MIAWIHGYQRCTVCAIARLRVLLPWCAGRAFVGCSGAQGMRVSTGCTTSGSRAFSPGRATLKVALTELGISATLYGVFARGLLTGSKPSGKGNSDSSCRALKASKGRRTRASSRSSMPEPASEG